MINIIEEGKTKFRATCDRCLCVFEYELSDLVKYLSCEYVKCPHCKHEIHHNSRPKPPTPPTSGSNAVKSISIIGYGDNLDKIKSLSMKGMVKFILNFPCIAKYGDTPLRLLDDRDPADVELWLSKTTSFEDTEIFESDAYKNRGDGL